MSVKKGQNVRKHNVNAIKEYIRKNPDITFSTFSKKFPKVGSSLFQFHRRNVRKESPASKLNTARKKPTNKPSVYISLWRYKKDRMPQSTKDAIESLIRALNKSEIIELELVSLSSPCEYELRTKSK